VPDTDTIVGTFCPAFFATSRSARRPPHPLRRHARVQVTRRQKIENADKVVGAVFDGLVTAGSWA